MNREESRRAMEQLGASPAARWIGNKLLDGGKKLLQKCTRCGAEQVMELPHAAVMAFQSGKRGNDLASQVPPNFDETLHAWKRNFQIAHESCPEKPLAA
jgi:hypothetical protein